jgi:hypothetical protein
MIVNDDAKKTEANRGSFLGMCENFVDVVVAVGLKRDI